MYGLKALQEQLLYVEERFPRAVNAAKCKIVISLLEFMDLLREHSKEDKKLFRQFRKEIMRLAFAGGY